MSTDDILLMDEEYVAHTYARFNVCLLEGHGCRAKAADGTRYLDFTSGIGVNSLGFADPAWAAAVAGQAATLQHTSNLYYTQPAAQLAQVLCQRTGMEKVFFANSGAEANEGAIKAARKYSSDKYGEGRSTIITLANSFHGRTMATLTATGQDSFHQHFSPFLQGFKYVPANDIGALTAALTKDVCAVMAEPIQGEGGVLPLDDAYFKQMEILCRQNDVLLIADEVQTGAGRTGKFLAVQHYGVQPDIVTMAKGLGGGLPIGAVLFAKSTADVLGKGHHATTFGANPVCCAGALAVTNRLTDEFLQTVTENGEYLRQELEHLPHVTAVSGKGLMLGISFAQPIKAADVLENAMENGLLTLLAKDKLRLLPPLIITQSEIDEGLEILSCSIGMLL